MDANKQEIIKIQNLINTIVEEVYEFKDRIEKVIRPSFFLNEMYKEPRTPFFEELFNNGFPPDALRDPGYAEMQFVSRGDVIARKVLFRGLKNQVVDYLRKFSQILSDHAFGDLLNGDNRFYNLPERRPRLKIGALYYQYLTDDFNEQRQRDFLAQYLPRYDNNPGTSSEEESD